MLIVIPADAVNALIKLVPRLMLVCNVGPAVHIGHCRSTFLLLLYGLLTRIHDGTFNMHDGLCLWTRTHHSGLTAHGLTLRTTYTEAKCALTLGGRRPVCSHLLSAMRI